MNARDAVEQPAPLRWLALGAAMLVQSCISLITFGLPALVPFIQSEMHLTAGQVGTFVSALTLGTMFALPVAGLLVDRLGERVVLATGGVVTGLMAMLVALPRGLWLSLMLLVLVGIGAATPTPAGSRAVMNWFPLRQRATAMGIRQTGIPVGGALATLILPPVAMAWGWRGAIGTAGVLAAASGVVAALVYRAAEGSADAHAGPDLSREAGGLRKAVDLAREILHRDVVLVGLLGLVLGLAQFCVLTYVILYVRDVRGMSVASGEALLLLANIGGGLGRIVWGLCSDRFCQGSRKRVLALITLLAAGAALLLAELPAGAPAGLLVAAVAALGFSGIGWNGLWVTLISELSPPGRHGATLGAAMLMTYVGIAAAPPLFGYLVDHTHSYRIAWLALAAVLAAGSLFLVPVREPTKEVANHG